MDSDDESPLNPAMFISPENSGDIFGFDHDDAVVELASAGAWDVAVRYHEFKNKKSMQNVAKKLRRLSAEAILQRAQAVLGSVVHVSDERVTSLDQLAGDAVDPELDLDLTFESSVGLLDQKVAVSREDVWLTHRVRRQQPMVLCVDTSLSMTGEKLALTAVALAVVLLQFPEDPLGIVAFENESVVLKHPAERISVGELIERFLDVPAQGYTHLESGLQTALSVISESSSQGRGVGFSRPPATVLISDGKYTAGRDPGYLGSRFDHLIVLKMGKEYSSLPLCEELASKGHGFVREVSKLESLPGAIYTIVKDVIRGRARA